MIVSSHFVFDKTPCKKSGEPVVPVDMTLTLIPIFGKGPLKR